MGNGSSATPSAMDLTTVEDVKSWIPGLAATTQDDDLIQFCITAWGFEFLRRTGRGDMGINDSASPFNEVVNYDEFYDGTGTSRLMVRNRPIVSVTALLINGLAISPSPAFSVQGYVIDGTKRSISLRPGLLGWGSGQWQSWQAGAYHKFNGLNFIRGAQNIELQYSAGYAETPLDIVQASNIVVAQNYKRRSWVDEASRSIAGGGGTIRYRDWEFPPAVSWVIDRYTRTL